MGAEDKNNPMAGITNMIQQMTQGMAGQAQTETPSGWLSSFKYPETFTFDPSKLINFAKSSLFATALSTGRTVFEASGHADQSCKSGLIKKSKELVANKFGAKCIYNADEEDLFYVFNSGALRMHIASGYIYFEIVSDTKNFISEFKGMIKELDGHK